MSVKPTILVFVLAVLGVTAMAMVMRADDGRSPAPLRARAMLTPDQLPVDKVDRITLRRAGQPALAFARSGPDWSQVEPFAHPMDSFSIRQLAAQAARLEVIDAIQPDEQDLPLATLGLDPPAGEITYQWEGRSLTLQLGRRGVAGRAYLRIAGDKRVQVVSQALHDRALEMDPKEWRERALFQNVNVELDRVERVAGANPDGSGGERLTMVRERRQWMMTEPARTRIDPVARDAFLGELARAKAGGFILDQPGDQPDDLAKFGLANPAATIAVTTGAASGDDPSDGQEGGIVQRLLIGARISISGQDRFGMIEGRPVVVRLSGALIAALFRAPRDLADPVVSGVQAADVKSLRIRTKEGEIMLERDLERWRAPQRGGAEVPPEFVEELLRQLTQLRAPDVQLQAYPTDLEVATITMHGFDRKALDTVRIARETESGQWALENGDNVLRVFPATMKMRLSAEDFGLTGGP